MKELSKVVHHWNNKDSKDGNVLNLFKYASSDNATFCPKDVRGIQNTIDDEEKFKRKALLCRESVIAYRSLLYNSKS